jgi:predicted ester cyclase
MSTNSPLEAYRLMQGYLFSGRFDKMGEVVDLNNYTENCVGLTGWTTGFQVALKNWVNGFGGAWTDLRAETEDALESFETGVVRQLMKAKHTGPLLGIPPTGREVSFEMIDMFKVKNGKIVWRWILPDLRGIEEQIRSKA